MTNHKAENVSFLLIGQKLHISLWNWNMLNCNLYTVNWHFKTNPQSINTNKINLFIWTKVLPVRFPFKIRGNHFILITIQTKMLHKCNEQF